MSKIKLNWITGKQLIERWNLTIRGLHLCIQSGIPVYNPNFELEEWGPIYRTMSPQSQKGNPLNGFASNEKRYHKYFRASKTCHL